MVVDLKAVHRVVMDIPISIPDYLRDRPNPSILERSFIQRGDGHDSTSHSTRENFVTGVRQLNRITSSRIGIPFIRATSMTLFRVTPSRTPRSGVYSIPSLTRIMLNPDPSVSLVSPPVWKDKLRRGLRLHEDCG